MLAKYYNASQEQIVILIDCIEIIISNVNHNIQSIYLWLIDYSKKYKIIHDKLLATKYYKNNFLFAEEVNFDKIWYLRNVWNDVSTL